MFNNLYEKMIQGSGFYKAVILGFKNCFDFKGRVSRAEYWLWSSFVMILTQLAEVLLTETVASVFLLLSIVPSLSNSVRRLHDVNYRGWWLLPIIDIWAIVVFFLPGDNEPNRFGNTPYPPKLTLLDQVLIGISVIFFFASLILLILDFITKSG